MEFEISPDLAHLFAGAVAAHIRSRAGGVEMKSEEEAWHELWIAFRDADGSTVKVSFEAGCQAYWVWGIPGVWRDEPTRQYVKGVLRPQWKAQMRARALEQVNRRKAAELITITFEPHPEPRRWTTDGGRLHWVAYGNVLVSCREHGEVIKALSTNLMDQQHPWMNSQAALWKGNHLRQEHGIDLQF
ncbi:hypothetical protein AB0L74_10200 [Streptomyces sp. NPDC052020]|uniref:hypothetical protein n=1 Tax=Streptomyces sp. NPDC052020 TaxID=3155677 RepID=UPI003418702F